ncbi:hypothetical protein K438DRAFT_1767880 [Mycena galopus ATCC 62051]|nr:hypothetical protein K438DRAFT_1767880 [Mycena galopus ATCC 62051]
MLAIKSNSGHGKRQHWERHQGKIKEKEDQTEIKARNMVGDLVPGAEGSVRCFQRHDLRWQAWITLVGSFTEDSQGSKHAKHQKHEQSDGSCTKRSLVSQIWEEKPRTKVTDALGKLGQARARKDQERESGGSVAQASLLRVEHEVGRRGRRARTRDRLDWQSIATIAPEFQPGSDVTDLV